MPTKKARELAQAKREWYSKLKEEGFKDIEQADGRLKFWSSNRLSAKDTDVLANAQSYYILAEHFLNEHKFDNNLQQIIWEYHSNGIAARKIVKLLADTKVIKTNRTTIWATIKALRNKMLLKYQVNNHGQTVN